MVGIFLGLPGQWAEDQLESSDHYTTKIGGLPDWPPLPNDMLRPELLNCCSCGSKLSLVAQVYAPVSTENSERTLYIFGCLMPKCGTSEQSWRAFSIQKAIKEKELSEKADLPVASPLATASKPHWLDDLDGDDDDDDEDFDFESLAKALAEAATTVASSNSKKPKSKPGGFNASSGTKAKPSSPFKSETDQIKVQTGAVVPCFYIYTKEENVSKDVDGFSMSYASMSSIKDKETSKGDESETEEAWEDEKYEYDKALNADRTYLKFKKRIDANPEQCFRYSYGGKPLLATQDLKSPDKCGHCDSPMLFEMQLMPALIYFLHEGVVDKAVKQSLDNWDWMTLILYTCSKSCANAVNGDWAVTEECIAVQYEKPMDLDHASFFK